jgi:hypothetical protein
MFDGNRKVAATETLPVTWINVVLYTYPVEVKR